MARWALAIAVVAVAAVEAAVIAGGGDGGSRGRARDQVGARPAGAAARGGRQWRHPRRGTGGDRATATYLAARLKAAGYRVRTQRRHLPPGAPQVRLVGDSDHASFERADIPAGGLFTGLDDCYHQPCDTIKNVDRKVLATSIAATEGTLVDLLAR